MDRHLPTDLGTVETMRKAEIKNLTMLEQIALYWMPRLTRLVVVDTWSGKYMINDAYRPIAAALVKKYPEISHIKTNEILFIDNVSGTGSTLDKKKRAQIGKIPSKWQEIIQQMTGRSFHYFMELFKMNVYEMSQEQIIALIYHELRHIDLDGDLKHHDLEDWTEMLEKLGPDWASTKAYIPDLLDEAVDWDSIQVLTLFEESKLKLVK